MNEATKKHIEDMEALLAQKRKEQEGKPCPPSIAWATADLKLYIKKLKGELK